MKGKLIALLMIALLVVSVVGCKDDIQDKYDSSQVEYNHLAAWASTGTIEVRMHDAPPEYDVKEVWVTIDQIEVHMATAERDQIGEPTPSVEPTQEPGTPTVEATTDSGTPVVEPTIEPTIDEPADDSNAGWITLAMSGTAPVDIIQYQDGLEAMLASQELGVGKYSQVRLAISKVEVVYSDGSGTEMQTAEAKLPSGKLKFTKGFEVNAGETTVLSFDFVADEAISFTGGGKVILKPVIKLDISYGAEEQKGKPEDKPTPTAEPSPPDEPTSNGTSSEVITPEKGEKEKPGDKPIPKEKPAPEDAPTAEPTASGTPTSEPTPVEDAQGGEDS